MLNIDEIKLSVAILAQAVIDAYIGNGRTKRSALDWFQNGGYSSVVEILKSSNIRFKNIFNLPLNIWGDIPDMILKNPFLVYYKCKPVEYLEGIKNNSGILLREGTKIRKSPAKKPGEKYRPAQLVHPLVASI
ncbi:MAG: hypothetical protein IBX72_13695 [Nitrospirae bacterium]|nr:hypothetical protein [Nitrospirota bacterium]